MRYGGDRKIRRGRRGLDGSHRRARHDDDDAQAFSAHDGRLYPLGAQPVR